MATITPFFWFDTQAEEAANFYVEIFDGEIVSVARYAPGTPGEEGSVMTVQFKILDQDFVALNGGPIFEFSAATSFVVNCATAEEVDHYWDSLLADGGAPSQCGWLTDRFGVTWQIVPDRLGQLMSDPDPEKAGRVAQAMMQMVKLDVAGLEAAYAGTDA